MQKERIRIVVVDDHAIMREGVRLLIEQQPDMAVIGEAADSKSALAVVAKCPPDLIILDVRLPDRDGIETAVLIRKSHPGVRIVLLSGFLSPGDIARSLALGISGFVSKVSAFSGVLQAVRTVMAGKLFVCPEMTTAMLQLQQGGVRGSPPAASLSKREKELLRLITDGRRNKEIASQLQLSTKSVEASRSRMMAKLSCSTPAELVRYAIREHLVIA